ncbi:hypothetical protein [Bacillus badius]|uniref:hypothetical protein n=1 Tax=Bacillus badius TaxID=1455 RepID=UPI0007B369A4|nr:hypothetical protein [Bacillus badius]KZR59343.1 hypothetical protein A3781_13155 [Bacillus badius]
MFLDKKREDCINATPVQNEDVVVINECSMKNKKTQLKSITDFFSFLYPDHIESGTIVISNLKNDKANKTKFISIRDTNKVEKYIENLVREEKDVYFNMALQDEKKAKVERIKSKRGKDLLIKRAFSFFFPKENRISEIAKATLEEERENYKNISEDMDIKKIKELEKKILSLKEKQEMVVPLLKSNPDQYRKFINEITDFTRGKTLTAKACFGVWLDVDVNIRGHHKNKDNQFETFESAYDFLMSLNIKPSVVVKSGGGFHVYYVLNEVEKFDTDKERLDFETIVRKFGMSIRKKAELLNKEGSIDTTFDLARMLRVPFTKNFKDKKNPKNVEVVYFSNRKYRKEELESMILPNILDEYSQKKSRKKREKEKGFKMIIQGQEYDSSEYTDETSLANAERIYEKCSFIKSCVDHQNDVGYFEWISMLQTVLHCENGENYAHKWSSEHDEYDESYTNLKLQYLSEYAPVTCERVEKELGCEHCINCPFKNEVNTPLTLGFWKD